MTGFIVSVFPFRNRVSPKEAFEGLELGEGKPSRPVLRGPGGRKAAWLLGNNPLPLRLFFPKLSQYQMVLLGEKGYRFVLECGATGENGGVR
jgi:hypothetical protein